MSRDAKRPIVLTGHLLAPKAGEAIVLTTPHALRNSEMDRVRDAVTQVFGDIPVFVMDQGSQLIAQQMPGGDSYRADCGDRQSHDEPGQKLVSMASEPTQGGVERAP